jgi:DNA-binding response OmpR family regulator
MSHRPRTILVADADARERQSMRLILRSHGYRVLEAVDYRDAENVCQQHPGEIDLLLTAIALPGNNGLQLAESLRRREPALKVLCVSAPVGAELCKFYDLETMEVHLLHKPLEAAQLLDRVRKALEFSKPQPGAASA